MTIEELLELLDESGLIITDWASIEEALNAEGYFLGCQIKLVDPTPEFEDED
jgi:hypothetical protein